jgi:2-polyprenyl-6-methoxyphenol hydroxylase-like FAD-dependent oxidoreductase
MGTSEPRIAIIGAGIGGLSLALALRERGIRADVFEQAAELTEIGAAIGIAGNSTRVPVENLPAMPDPQAIQFWISPDAHVLHYAIGGGSDSVNFFAVVEGPKSWTAEGSVAPVSEDVPSPRSAAGIRRSSR